VQLDASPPREGPARDTPAPAGPWIDVATPEGAAEIAPSRLPALDVSSLPGATLVAYRGVAVAPSVTVYGACVRGPSDRWVPGLEVGALDESPPLRTQSFSGSGRDAEREVSLRGVHVLGFAGESKDVVVCSVACLEPRDGGACDPLIASVTASGPFGDEPPPGLLARTLVLVAEHPSSALALLAGACAGGVALLLSRRPRPRRSR
jgi:hypothetical protein